MDGLQSIPRQSNDKDMAAMLDELTVEANEESFVIVLQHGRQRFNMQMIYTISLSWEIDIHAKLFLPC